MLNQPLINPHDEPEDMAQRQVDGPLVPVQPILDWLAAQPERPLNDKDGFEAIRKQFDRARDNGGMLGFHMADRICCKLKAPMYQVYGDLYWYIAGI